MSILLWVEIVYGILILIGIGIFSYDTYKYPVCPQCECNLYSKRIKGKIICQIQGEIRKEKTK